jgi:hypothetical protein
MSWYKVTHIPTSSEENIFEQFKKFYLEQGTPPDLALFSVTSESDGTTALYLTPNAATYPELLKQFQAVEGGRPAATAKLEMGHQDAAGRFQRGQL